jgi:hypothetical protein
MMMMMMMMIIMIMIMITMITTMLMLMLMLMLLGAGTTTRPRTSPAGSGIELAATRWVGRTTIRTRPPATGLCTTLSATTTNSPRASRGSGTSTRQRIRSLACGSRHEENFSRTHALTHSRTHALTHSRTHDRWHVGAGALVLAARAHGGLGV